MWLVTTQGFYSAVSHWDADDTIIVRARVKGDLVNLDRQIPGLKGRMFQDRSADYPWRVFVSREEWALACARLAGEVDYGNFKSAVGKRQGHARAGVYHSLWSVLTRLERGFEKRYYGRWRDIDLFPARKDGGPLFDDEEQDPLPAFPFTSESRSITRSRGRRRR